MNQQFPNGHKITQLSTVTAGAAGASSVNSSSIDMANFEQATFIVPFGTIVSTAVTSIKVQGSSDNSSFTDLAGTGVTIADTDDDKTFYVNVVKPTYRYLRCVVSRATANATFGGVLVIQSNPRTMPVTQGTAVSGESWVSPAAGTA